MSPSIAARITPARNAGSVAADVLALSPARPTEFISQPMLASMWLSVPQIPRIDRTPIIGSQSEPNTVTVKGSAVALRRTPVGQATSGDETEDREE